MKGESDGVMVQHHQNQQSKLPKPELKRLVASVFSRIQGTDAFRKMKLRQNTDANVEMTLDQRFKDAVYVKPHKKINEHDCGVSTSSGGSGGEETHEKASRSSKRVCFGEYVEEICFRGSILSEEDKKDAAEVLEILNLDHQPSQKNKMPAGAEEKDEVLAAIIKARGEREEALEEWQHGPGPKITFIPLDGEGTDGTGPSSPNRMFRMQTMRQKALGHDNNLCELLLRYNKENEDEELEEEEVFDHEAHDGDDEMEQDE